MSIFEKLYKGELCPVESCVSHTDDEYREAEQRLSEAYQKAKTDAEILVHIIEIYRQGTLLSLELSNELTTEKTDNVTAYSKAKTSRRSFFVSGRRSTDRLFCPFILLLIEEGRVIEDVERNEAKHRVRALRYGSRFDINDGEFEEHNPEFAFADDEVDRFERNETLAEILTHLKTIDEIPKRRIKRYYFMG